MSTLVQEKQYTLEEYFELEYSAKTRHLFDDGKIIPMAAYTSKSHGRIVQNISQIIGACLEKSASEVYPGDRMLYVPFCKKTFYPDLIILPVDVETLSYKGKMEAELHPNAIIEILSDSTEEDDRTEKWRCYQMIDSLQQYLLISQKRPYVETYFRQEEKGKWMYTSAQDMEGQVDIHGCPIALSDIYNRVVFTEPA